MSSSFNTSSSAREASHRSPARRAASHPAAYPSSSDDAGALFTRFPAEPAFAATWNPGLLDSFREPLTRYHE